MYDFDRGQAACKSMGVTPFRAAAQQENCGMLHRRMRRFTTKQESGTDKKIGEGQHRDIEGHTHDLDMDAWITHSCNAALATAGETRQTDRQTENHSCLQTQSNTRPHIKFLRRLGPASCPAILRFLRYILVYLDRRVLIRRADIFIGILFVNSQ
jgi:hypothetical protein